MVNLQFRKHLFFFYKQISRIEIYSDEYFKDF